ncbi:MAG: hypothetical protein IKB01_12145 [Lachnospiraceae bacterium]|nr:hypothetical protein [Lachnospiraceae bacterium]
MTEKQRIMEMMEKHKAYFENVKGVDVAFSTKGECFFYEYNEEYRDYSTFVKFSTAEELEQIIDENIATDYCVNLQDIAEEMLHTLDETDIQNVDVTNISQECSEMNRKTLINAFVIFSKVIERVYKDMQPFQAWVDHLNGVKESGV